MRAGRRDVPLTHPDKVLFPDDGITKADLAAYYRDVAPADGRRSCATARCRCSASTTASPSQGFFQKNVERGAPDWVKRVRGRQAAAARSGTSWPTTPRRSCGWPTRTASRRTSGSSRADRLERPGPDDLRPRSRRRADDFALVRRTARELGDVLREAGVEPFAMTTGSKGIHVVVALQRRYGFGAGARRRGRGGRASSSSAGPRT